MSSLQHALELAAKGFKVFPVPANNKRVVLEDWPNKATTDPAKIRAWFTDYDGDPVDSNIGICTNDLLVIDIEGEAKGGRNPYDVLSDIEAELGPLPHVAETPSGGFHAYLRLPPGAKVANTAKTVWPGVDTRSWHGYVLAPGSAIDGKPYKWLIAGDGKENWPPASIDDLPVAPDHLIAKIGAPKPKADLPSNITYDTPASIDQAIDFLKRTPPAIQGDGGDFTTFKTAARVRDFAVSESVALDLMLDHWNPRCEPPWDPEELQAKVNNAYRYAENTPKEPGSEFGAVDIGVTEGHSGAKPDWPAPTPLAPFDPADLPDRDWIIPGMAARTFVTGLIAPSGAGKTQFLAQLIIAASANRPDTIGAPSVTPSAVWCWNQEDDLIELQRRIGASFVHFGATHDHLAHAVYLDSGVDRPLIVAARDAQGRIRETKNVARIIEHMKAKGIGILIIDPLVEFHEANENDNVEMNIVGRAIRRIAKEANAAVIIGHHTRKPPTASSDGFAGNADSGRGAGALNATTRITLTLYTMTPKDAKAFGVPEERRTRYLRIDGARTNIGFAAAGALPDWFERVGQPLRPGGEEVGVLKPVHLGKTESRVKRESSDEMGVAPANSAAEHLAAALAAMDGAADGVPWPSVQPKFLALTGMGEGAARKWLSRLADRTRTSLGVIEKSSAHRKGTFVALLLDETWLD